jgi:hypothetical protein
MLVALGIAAAETGHRVRYFTAADLVETLYRGLADNSVGKLIDTLLRNDVVLVEGRVRSVGRHRSPAAVPVRRRRLRTQVPRHRIARALRILGTAPARTHRRNQRRVLPDETGPKRREEPDSKTAELTAKSGAFYLTTSADQKLAVGSVRRAANRNRVTPRHRGGPQN